MEKKVIKVQFCDFWSNFVLEESHLYKTLTKRYDVIICDKPDFLFIPVIQIRIQNIKTA